MADITKCGPCPAGGQELGAGEPGARRDPGDPQSVEVAGAGAGQEPGRRGGTVPVPAAGRWALPVRASRRDDAPVVRGWPHRAGACADRNGRECRQ